MTEFSRRQNAWYLSFFDELLELLFFLLPFLYLQDVIHPLRTVTV